MTRFSRQLFPKLQWKERQRLYEKACASGVIGRCAICNKPFDRDKGEPCLDHDHMTNYLRGFLCSACNKLLGFARDNAHILARAISYLNGATLPNAVQSAVEGC